MSDTEEHQMEMHGGGLIQLVYHNFQGGKELYHNKFKQSSNLKGTVLV